MWAAKIWSLISSTGGLSATSSTSRPLVKQATREPGTGRPWSARVRARVR